MRKIVGGSMLAVALISLAACSPSKIADAIDKPKESKQFLTDVQAAVTKTGIVQITPLEGEPMKPNTEEGGIIADYSKPTVASQVLFKSGSDVLSFRFLPTGDFISTTNGKQWFKNEPNSQLMKDKDFVSSVKVAKLAANPLVSLEATPEVKTVDGFRNIGTDTVDGVKVTKWQAKQVEGTRVGAWDAFNESPAGTKLDTKAADFIEIWLDDKGFPRRVMQGHQSLYVAFQFKPGTPADAAALKAPTGAALIKAPGA